MRMRMTLIAAALLALCLAAAPPPARAAVELTVVDPLKPIYGPADVRSDGDVLLMVGPRGGVASAQVVATGEGLREVRAAVSALRSEEDTIPADALGIYYAVKVEDYPIGREAAERDEEHRFLEPYYDALHPEPPPQTGEILPIWLVADIPAEAAPGTYGGRLSVGEEAVPVELTVGAWRCPPLTEAVTHVGFVPSHDALAKHYEVEPWSEEHWDLIEQQLRLLGGVGADDLWIWVSPQRQARELALVRFRTEGDRLAPDFSILDRYLELFDEHVGRPQWALVHVWNRPPRRGRRTIEETQPGWVDGEWGEIPRPETLDAEELWQVVMDGIHERVTARGWDESSIVLSLSSDQTPCPWTVQTFQQVAPYARWAIWSHMRGGLRPWAFPPDEPIVYANEQVNAYFAHVYTPSPSVWIRRPDERVRRAVIEDGIQGGWNAVRDIYTSLRNDLHRFHTLPQYRNLPNGTMITVDRERGGDAGFAFIWFDFWQRDFPNGWMRTGTRWNTGSIVETGPDGPIPTVRYQAVREGLQDTEARLVVERALAEDALPESLAEEARALLMEMMEVRYGGRTDEGYAFSGGHAGSTLGRPGHTWRMAEYPRWQEMLVELFALADRVQRHAGEAR